LYGHTGLTASLVAAAAIDTFHALGFTLTRVVFFGTFSADWLVRPAQFGCVPVPLALVTLRTLVPQFNFTSHHTYVDVFTFKLHQGGWFDLQNPIYRMRISWTKLEERRNIFLVLITET